MKPTTTNKNQPNPKTISPSLPRRVTVQFLPQSGWPVEIGRTPVKAFAAPQTVRDNAPATGYKRTQGTSRPASVFVPVGLAINAEKQRPLPRRNECRAVPKLPVNL